MDIEEDETNKVNKDNLKEKNQYPENIVFF